MEGEGIEEDVGRRWMRGEKKLEKGKWVDVVE